jgi:histone H3/H4
MENIEEIIAVKRSAIKPIAKHFGIKRISGKSVAEALNKAVIELIKRGCERAKKNNRRTLQGKDI